MVFFPAILFPPGEDGLAGCVVPGPNINAGGASSEAALDDAVSVLTALIAEADAGGEDRPRPLTVEAVQREIDDLGGVLVWLPAISPRAAA
ncbi:MAG TPA: hypothetical protein DDY29_05770 [Rhodobacteraceae bacterium]|nr:hypothetical protein [Paracoccaceae bacterium]